MISLPLFVMKILQLPYILIFYKIMGFQLLISLYFFLLIIHNHFQILMNHTSLLREGFSPTKILTKYQVEKEFSPILLRVLLFLFQLFHFLDSLSKTLELYYRSPLSFVIALYPLKVLFDYQHPYPLKNV